MERNPFAARLVAVGLASLVTLGACVGGSSGENSAAAVKGQPDDAITIAAPSPTAPQESATPTTEAPTSNQPSAPATTAPAPTTDRASNTQVGDGAGTPWVEASPARGIVGTRIHIEGYGFTEERWKFTDNVLWLASNSGCGRYAEAMATISVSADGHLSGDFTVPSRGVCPQGSDEGGLGPGTYKIAYQCTACFIGEFEITPPAPHLVVRCNDVGFTPNSDNVASNILANGISCPEAEAFVREVGGPLGPVNGAPTAEADGFLCERTSQFEGRGLPLATYQCTKGSQVITFDRT